MKANLKSKKTKKKNFGIIKVFTLIIGVYFVYTLYSQQIDIDRYDSQIQMYQSDIENKERLIEYFKSQKATVHSDEFVEYVAREQLGYVKPYEKIFIDVNK